MKFNSNGFSKQKESGLTIIELLVATSILVVVMTIVISTSMSGIKLYKNDKTQVAANDYGRSTMDVLGSDLRQVGERLTSDFPAVIINNDARGNSVLSLRRGLLDDPLPICAPINGGTTIYTNTISGNTLTARASYLLGLIPNYDLVYADNTYSLSSTLQSGCTVNDVSILKDWKTAIESKKITTGYVYDVVKNSGEFVDLKAVDLSRDTIETVKPISMIIQPRIANSKSTAKIPTYRLYLLEDRTYSINGNSLMLSLNGKAPVVVAPNVTKFMVKPYLAGTLKAAALPFPNISDGSWRGLAYLDTALTVGSKNGSDTLNKTFEERTTPRNSLSNDTSDSGS